MEPWKGSNRPAMSSHGQSPRSLTRSILEPILRLLALAFAAASLGLGCKKASDCDKAVDHVVHLSYLETQKALAEVPPEVRAETAKMMPTEETMRPKLREVITKRFSARCQDAAFTKCVLAASDAFAVARCEFPQ